MGSIRIVDNERQGPEKKAHAGPDPNRALASHQSAGAPQASPTFLEDDAEELSMTLANLPKNRLETELTDKKPLYSAAEARAEADRCLFASKAAGKDRITVVELEQAA